MDRAALGRFISAYGFETAFQLVRRLVRKRDGENELRVDAGVYQGFPAADKRRGLAGARSCTDEHRPVLMGDDLLLRVRKVRQMIGTLPFRDLCLCPVHREDGICRAERLFKTSEAVRLDGAGKDFLYLCKESLPLQYTVLVKLPERLREDVRATVAALNERADVPESVLVVREKDKRHRDAGVDSLQACLRRHHKEVGLRACMHGLSSRGLIALPRTDNAGSVRAVVCLPYQVYRAGDDMFSRIDLHMAFRFHYLFA